MSRITDENGIEIEEQKVHQLTILPTKSDAEIASDFKLRAIEAWKPLLSLMEDAHKQGFQVAVNAGLNELGQAFIHNLVVSRIYK